MAIDYAAASRLNSHYSRCTSPPWVERIDQVITELGFRNMTPGADAFAAAVSDWQGKNSLEADGILGPRTWARMEPSTRYCIDVTAAPLNWISLPFGSRPERATTSYSNIPTSGGIPAAVGMPATVRIPVPNTPGLAIEFFPRNFKGNSTSTLFIQNTTGKKVLRLDYGYNIKTNTINYHWNQSGTFANFNIQDHAVVGRNGRSSYQAAKYFRHAGRVLVVVGAAVDGYSIVVADKPLRRATAVVTAWAAAWAGCKIVGAGGAAAGTLASPFGTAAGGVGGCIIGGIGGYYGGQVVGETVYDWAEGTSFHSLDEVSAPR